MLCYKKHWNFDKVISLSTDVPACFSIKVLVFQKNDPNSPKYGKTKSHLKVISLATSKGTSLSTFGGQKSTQNVDKLMPFGWPN